MSIEEKNLELKLSSLGEDGTFDGLLSAYGNVDAGGDVVERGAYTKTLAESGGKIPICWAHNPADPIGGMLVKDSDSGLLVKGKLNLDENVPTARRAHSMMKFFQEFGLKMGLSIGYRTIRREFKDGNRHLKELQLVHGGIVTTPMNSECIVTNVKAADGGAKDFVSSLEAIQLWATKYQMLQALGESLDMVFYGNSGRDEKIAEVKTIWAQANDAYMEWLPKLLDLWGVKEFPQEAKAGRVVSAANRKRIEEVMSHLKALLDSDSTSEEDAGKSAPDAANKTTAPGLQELHPVLQLISTFKL